MADRHLYSEEVVGSGLTEILATLAANIQYRFFYIRIEQRATTAATVSLKKETTESVNTYLTANQGMLDERSFGDNGVVWGETNAFQVQADAVTTYYVEVCYRTEPC